MPERIIAPKIQRGNTIRVSAPSFSASIFKPDLLHSAAATLQQMGLSTTYGNHSQEIDQFRSSSIESRVADIHAAFEDPDVNGIISVIGGWSANQLLQYLNYDLIRANPKMFCGFSDVDALNNAIQAKTGLITYSGPHHIFFGQERDFEYTKKHFEKAVMGSSPFKLEPSKQWSDDDWTTEQQKRNFIPNEGLVVIQDGSAEGKVVGGNLCTLNLLQGTEYMPQLDDVILFLEEAKFSLLGQIDRDLQSLVQSKGFKPKGLVFGRFQPNTISISELFEILRTKKEFKNIPIIANADFGHTDPKGTIPLGGTAKIVASKDGSLIEFIEH